MLLLTLGHWEWVISCLLREYAAKEVKAFIAYSQIVKEVDTLESTCTGHHVFNFWYWELRGLRGGHTNIK